MKFSQFHQVAKDYAAKRLTDRKVSIPPMEQAAYRHDNRWYFTVSSEDLVIRIAMDQKNNVLIHEVYLDELKKEGVTDPHTGNASKPDYFTFCTQAQFEAMAHD